MSSGDLVERALEALFPGEKDRSRVRAALATYGLEPHERESDRVRLAILKLAEERPAIVKVAEARAEAVDDLVAIARRDYSDVLMWAESPELARSPRLLMLASRDPASRQAIDEMARRDSEQYQKWLARVAG